MIRVKNGELHQLGQLFERYSKPVFGFFYNMYGDTMLCEDLVQNTFMRVIKYRHSFAAEGEFSVWLFRIARNVGYDHFRKPNSTYSDISEIENLSDGVLNHEESMMESENMMILRLAIDRLDYEKREILTLSKLEGMKYKDISKILNCTENVVKTRVFRALKSLKTEFEHIRSKV